VLCIRVIVLDLDPEIFHSGSRIWILKFSPLWFPDQVSIVIKISHHESRGVDKHRIWMLDLEPQNYRLVWRIVGGLVLNPVSFPWYTKPNPAQKLPCLTRFGSESPTWFMTNTELRWDLGILDRINFRPVTEWMDLHSRTDPHSKSGSAFEKQIHIQKADPHSKSGSAFEKRLHIRKWIRIWKADPYLKCGFPFQMQLRIQKPQLRETKPSDTQMGVRNIECYRISTDVYICSYSVNSYIYLSLNKLCSPFTWIRIRNSS
jgi:hypothetical protein